MTIAQSIDEYLLAELQKITTANGYLSDPKVCNICERQSVEAHQTLLQLMPAKERIDSVNGKAMKLQRTYKVFGSARMYGVTDLAQFNALMTDVKKALHTIHAASGSQPFSAVEISDIEIEVDNDAVSLFACELKVTYVEKFGE